MLLRTTLMPSTINTTIASKLFFANRKVYKTYVRRFECDWPSYHKNKYGRLDRGDFDIDKKLWDVDDIFKLTLEEDLAP